MANKDELMSNSDTNENAELDRILDAALARYAMAEPRPGLEGRILANLRGAEVEVRHGRWWIWGLAATAAILLVIGTLGWKWTTAAHQPIAHHSAPAPQRPAVPELATRDGNTPPQIKRAPRRVARHAPQHEVVAANPKLDVFPSPLPLTAEEVALAQYVRDFPNEAQLVAQAQQEFDRETQKEMNDAGSETRQSGSIQQER